MAAPLVAITDGTAPARAISRWLVHRGVELQVIEARSSTDAARLIAIRRRAGENERLLALTAGDADVDIDGAGAVALAAAWLSELTPIEQRSAVAEIDTRFLAGSDESEPLAQLLRAAKVDLRNKTTKPGRPRGSDPFKGVGFDVIVAMLVWPNRRWTERELSVEIDRSRSAVHRVLRELTRRGYMLRSPGSTGPRKPEVLRDDLVASWRARAASRAIESLATPRPAGELVRELQRLGVSCLAAGPSAAGPDGPLERALTVYADDEARAAMIEVGCEKAAPGLGDLIVWAPAERAVFYAPRSTADLAATNRVVTFIDLAVGSSRHRRAAQSVWEENA